MVNHNYETVLMHFARKKEMENLWDYSTGLRGNDDVGLSVDNDIFKETITTVIRGNVKGAFAFDDSYPKHWLHLYNNDPSYVIAKMDKALKTVSTHARMHMERAMRALAIYYARRHGKEYKKFSCHLIKASSAIRFRNAEVYLTEFKILHSLWTDNNEAR